MSQHVSSAPDWATARRTSRLINRVSIVLIAGVGLFYSYSAHAQIDNPNIENPLRPLKSVPVPGPSDAALMEIVKDKKAAIQLGKALFWDARVGSDNKTACATCHFSAGADNRSKNQVSPGLLSRDSSLNSSSPDTTFQVGNGPNHVLKSSNFPLTKFSSISSNDPAARMDVNDVISSQGVFNGTFQELNVKGNVALADTCRSDADPDGFSIHGINTRRVEPRNSPTVINAVFNLRNFWDGRGNNMFNSGDPFGLRNTEASVW
jgi:cytochrome c553